MNNLIRWGLCQSFGKEKGVILFDALFAGALGEAIRHTDSIATKAAIDAATNSILSRYKPT